LCSTPPVAASRAEDEWDCCTYEDRKDPETVQLGPKPVAFLFVPGTSPFTHHSQEPADSVTHRQPLKTRGERACKAMSSVLRVQRVSSGRMCDLAHGVVTLSGSHSHGPGVYTGSLRNIEFSSNGHSLCPDLVHRPQAVGSSVTPGHSYYVPRWDTCTIHWLHWPDFSQDRKKLLRVVSTASRLDLSATHSA